MNAIRSFASPLALAASLVACGGSTDAGSQGNADSGAMQGGGTGGSGGSSGGAAGKGGAGGSTAGSGGAGGGTTDAGTGGQGGTVAKDAAAGSLHWYATCGDPVCRAPGETPDSGVAACGSIHEGDVCSEQAATCDPGTGCGVLLRCTNAPVNPGMCPVSSAKYKKDINYLTEPDLEKLAETVQKIKLATYNYKDQPPEEQKHLGFIIEDNPKSPAVFTNREKVDLYGYASMAVAALQVQDKQIRALEQEVADLRAEVAKVKAQSASRAGSKRSP